MTRMIIAVLAIANVIVTVSTAAQPVQDVDGDGIVTVLLPVAFDEGQMLPGARHSEWTGALWAHNTSTDVAILPQGPCHVPVCPSLSTDFIGILSGFQSVSPDRGTILELPAEYAGGVELSNRIYESTGGAQPLGVEVPVVREHEFFTEAEFLGVPVDVANRIALRVYDPARTAGGAVLVSVLNPEGQVVGQQQLHPGADPQMSRFIPGYDALHDLVSQFPQVETYDHIHVRVESVTPGLRFWGFVSVTDNETQHVTIISSQ